MSTTRAALAWQILRWILAGIAVVVAFYGVFYFSLHFLFFGPLPPELGNPTSGLLFGLVPVLAGALAAPRHQVLTASFLFLCGVPLAIAAMGFFIPGGLVGALVGGLGAIGFVAWWSHPRPTLRSILWVGVAACVTLLCFTGFVRARFVYRPAFRDEPPWELTKALGPGASRVRGLYLYDLGGFIDSQYLWRIDADAGVVALIVSGLEMHRIETVPAEFWQMPPYYWPNSMPAKAEAFVSQDFFANERGPDGVHYFMVYDQTQERAFVWIKNNF